MRGVGGPLLCIGDLLHDLADDVGGDHDGSPSTVSPSLLSPSCSSTSPGSGSGSGRGGGGPVLRSAAAMPLPPSDLPGLFQETYNQLTESLRGTDHSWTVLTLKLCSAVDTADKLVNSASSNVELLLEKVNMLDSIIKRSDSAVEIAKAIQGSGVQSLKGKSLHMA
uniref:Protein transport protein SEC31 n=1 Tax=Anthurium amnicola TaxID=1678845 RepID=A0A1D1XJE6_9ARAE